MRTASQHSRETPLRNKITKDTQSNMQFARHRKIIRLSVDFASANPTSDL